MVAADPALAAVKSYDYLRIALAALVLLLYVSIALESWAADGCLQPSISAYYYTPVHAVLIGVLVTIGVCLVALKGNTDGEDALMNLAGMLAPAVAFIPTTAVGSCSSTPLPVAPDTAPGAVNNMVALFVTGVVVALVVLAVARRAGGSRGLSEADRRGTALSLGVLAAGILWFVVDRDGFLAHGHDATAVPMFLAIVGVVWLNARDVQQAVRQGATPPSRGRFVGVYRAIATGMLLALVGTVVLSLLTGSTSLVLWVEVVLITLFAGFWVVQTVELWNRGLRRT